MCVEPSGLWLTDFAEMSKPNIFAGTHNHIYFRALSEHIFFTFDYWSLQFALSTQNTITLTGLLISTPLPGNKITLGHKRQQIVLALRFVELSPLFTKSSATPPADISSTKYFQINWLLDTTHDRIMRTWNTMEHAMAEIFEVTGGFFANFKCTFFYQHKYDTKSYAHTIEYI